MAGFQMSTEVGRDCRTRSTLEEDRGWRTYNPTRTRRRLAARVGYAGLPPVEASIDLEWSDDALADLDRFAAFLHDQSPGLAAIVAQEIIARAQILSRHPKLGRPLSTREEYRQLVLEVLGAAYVFQYRYDGDRFVMLRVFHGRESR